MDEYKRQLNDIAEIRQMMEESSRFLSLSGLSGVSAGMIALIGAFFTYHYLSREQLYLSLSSRKLVRLENEQLLVLVGIALSILLFAGLTAFYFTSRNARKRGQRLWSPSSRRVLFNILIPLLGGAAFCVIVAWHGFGVIVGPATLIFYGLALVNAGKYTHREIYNLGLVEILLGLIAGLFPQYSIFFWSLGFGVLHIVYGIFMYLKYERKREGSPQ